MISNKILHLFFTLAWTTLIILDTVSTNPNPIKTYPGLKYIGSSSTPSNINGIMGMTKGSLYYISSEQKNWGQALTHCKELTEGVLLSIETNAENELIHEKLTAANIPTIWTSGAYDTANKVWKWASTGGILDYTKWRVGQPITINSAYRVTFWSDMSFNSDWLVVPSSTINHFICEISTTPVPVPCFQKNDLVMVLDGSGSIGAENFIKAKAFVALLASAFGAPSRISLIVYSTTSNTVFDLNNSLSPSQIDTAINSAAYPGGGTATDLGINSAVDQLIHSQPGVPRKMVVFTDGASNDGQATKAAAAKAHANGIKTYSVGIANFNQAELLDIAGGIKEHVFTTDNFDSLIQLIKPLSIIVCEN